MTGSQNCVFFTDRGIKGITSLEDKIYLIRYNKKQIRVYDSHYLKALSEIDLPDLKSSRGLAGCSCNKALYISDSGLNCIHRIDITNNSSSRWNVTDRHWPEGLSVTSMHTLLVTMQIRGTEGESTVLEYRTDGQQMREIKFDESIKHAWKTIQLSVDQFIVSHGCGSSLHRLCVIKAEGRITKSYGENKGRAKGYLSNPYSLAIDENSKHLFVADHGNNRVLRLDFDLNYLYRVHTPVAFRWPSQIYFDSSSERLLVDSKDIEGNGFLSSSVTAKQIQHKKSTVCGVTVVDDKIYVVRDNKSQVNVYDFHSLTASPDIHIPDLKWPRGLAGCSYNRALYVCDDGLKCIHRVDLLTKNSFSRWNIDNAFVLEGLSITSEHTLLVAVRFNDIRFESRLMEYTSRGEQVREIRLVREIDWAHHAVRLSCGLLVIAHGLKGLLRVIIINAEGLILKSYGDTGQLEPRFKPVSLAIDENNKNIFVADPHHSRIAVLDRRLTKLGYVHIPVNIDICRPFRLHYDSSTDRLLVGEIGSGRVLVISPSD